MNFKKYRVWYFLILTIIVYIALSIFYPINITKAIKRFISILEQIWYILIIVFILMVTFNYYLNPKNTVKHMNNTHPVKIWSIAIISGILSSGPIYIWFPLLKDLKEKGVKDRYLIAFLYNRAIKIPLLPIIAIYFSLKYVIILTIVMIIVSIIQGLIVEKIIN